MDYSAEPSVWFAAGPPSHSAPVFASMPFSQSTPSTSSLASFASLASGASFTAGAGTEGVTAGGCTGFGLVAADAMPTPPSISPMAATDVSNRRRLREPPSLVVFMISSFGGDCANCTE